MRRDFTVWLSLPMIIVSLIIGIAMGMPAEIDQDDPPVFHVLFWIILAGAIRATVLWSQTLLHGIRHAKEENRAAVVMGHLFRGPIMSYGYYLSSRLDAKKTTEVASPPPV